MALTTEYLKFAIANPGLPSVQAAIEKASREAADAEKDPKPATLAELSGLFKDDPEFIEEQLAKGASLLRATANGFTHLRRKLEAKNEMHAAELARMDEEHTAELARKDEKLAGLLARIQ